MGKRLHAPNVGYVVEEGAVCPDPQFPLPRMMLGSSGVHFRAVQWTSMLMVGSHAALGFMDYGLLAALQVDRFGNFNSTYIGGSFDKPERRFGGPGGANEIASQCWRTIVMTKLQKRKFVEKCDFVSSPGYLDGTPGARERAGLPPGTGPWRIVTAEATFGFDVTTHEMRLDAVAPWTSVEEVLDLMEFRPLVADRLATMQAPTDEELKMIRADIDPGGFSTSKGDWVTIDAATGKKVSQ
jgi:glutaconate CoA-transferase subunit B